MAQLTRDVVIEAALTLLDEEGLDRVSTRQLASRLGVEQPALYWHFRNKAALLAAMAEAAMRPHSEAALPVAGDDWRTWFASNYRSFRATLHRHRDGARLHAGSHPAMTDQARIDSKMAFLAHEGFATLDARMAMLAAGRYTLGCVLEEQAEAARCNDAPATVDHDTAFEAGLGFIIHGIAKRQEKGRPK